MKDNFKCLFIFLFLASSIHTLYSQNNEPNILLIIADDMGTDAMPGYLESNRLPITPNLDMLRANGITFTNTWATPSCSPTRAAIMSAKYGIKTGVQRPPGQLDLVHESIFTKIKENTNGKYAGAVFGKWHISNPINFNHPTEHGIDHFEGLISGTVTDYFDWQKTTNGQTSQITEYLTTELTNNAIDWIDEQEQPWFLWLAHIAPHSPFHVPPEDLFTVGNTNNNVGKFIAMIEAMDAEIGRLLDSMDAETRENTIIIFIGDNGTPNGVSQGFPGGHGKASMYEGGLRVPMVISGNGVGRINEIDDNLTQVADLHATILELTGTQVAGGQYNSLSLLPLLNSAQDLNREYIYSDAVIDNTQEWAIRNLEYKLIEDELGNQEFYNVANDLFEENNLIDNLSNAEATILAEMEVEAAIIRNDWSCQDGIQNGEETMIDNCEDIIISTKDILESQILLTPNPSNANFNIELPNDESVEIRINTIDGKFISSLKGRNVLQIQGLETGIYLIQISFADGTSIIKRQVISK